MSYAVVEEFERALCEYTGAPYAVTTNSCSMAILLAIRWDLERFWEADHIRNPRAKRDRLVRVVYYEIPAKTYASVPMSIRHAGGRFMFSKEKWKGSYRIKQFKDGKGGIVWDSARRFTSGMYRAGQMQCVSFQTSKILGLEQGGAILHDNQDADTWLRRARFDGRLNASEKVPQMVGWHCYLNPSTAALGIQRLACLPRNNPDQVVEFPDLSELDIFK